MGTLAVIALVFSIYYSHTPLFMPIFILLNIGVMSLALREYYDLSRNKGFHPSDLCGIAISAAYTLSLSLSFYNSSWSAISSLVLLFLFIILFLAFFKQADSALGNLAVTLFGIIYLTIPLCCVLRINYFFPEGDIHDGRLWLAYTLVVTKITDISAYFCGKLWGKKKLAPTISPKKTVEGALGGLAAALLTSILFFLLAGQSGAFHITLGQSLWIGLIISILAQLGDLSESLLKRDAGVKDSSHLPGFGGMLDIVDSLVFPLPLMYLLLKMGIVT